MSDIGAPEKQHFHLQEFDGPLDLLLFLIKKSEVNIYDIPIASITEQYLSVLGWSAKVDLDTMSEFYLMAATLLYIKSRMLLPMELDLDDEIEDPRRELVEKLIEYQKFRRLSDLMSEKEGEVEWIVERGRDQRILPFADDGIWGEVSVWDLLQTFSSLLSTLSAERIIDLYEEVSVNEKVTLIGEMLESRDEFLFTDLLRRRSVLEVVCAFFAVLELVKARRITVFQNRLFGDIRIRGAGRRLPRPLSAPIADRAALRRGRRRHGMSLSREAALVEAVLLLESEPIELRRLAAAAGLEPEAAAAAVSELREALAEGGHGLEIVDIGGGFSFAPHRDLWEGLRGRYGKSAENRLFAGRPRDAGHHRVFTAHHPGRDREHPRRAGGRHDPAPGVPVVHPRGRPQGGGGPARAVRHHEGVPEGVPPRLDRGPAEAGRPGEGTVRTGGEG